MSSNLKQFLGFICSNDQDVRDRSAKFLITTSILHPEIIISNIQEIHFLILTHCHTNEPNWGTISSIIMALTNAIFLSSTLTQETLVLLIKISYDITHSFLHTTSPDHFFRPHMYPFIDAIEQKIQNGFKMNLDILLAICDHCAIGFAPYTTMIPILFKKFDEIEQIILTCDASYYQRLTAPIESPEIEIVFFFISMWVIIIKDLITRPRLIQALMRHSKQLLELSNSVDPTMSKPAQFLLDCVKALSPQVGEIKRISEEMRPQLLNLIEIRMNSNIDEITARIKKSKEKPKVYSVYRANAKVLSKKGRKTSWKSYELVLIEEANILMWTDNKAQLHDGTAVHMTEIMNAVVLPPGKKEMDKENVIKFDTKKGAEYAISFKTHQEAIQWHTLISKLLVSL
ncbi:hypothetical protein GPJ56_007850 [Histomonas meleagridis]|uniref:uncharacterized protein n=1 Tax=Histomonas meleagridis TaxID=135588 RepID=UPI00355A1FA3|nr:hypothetical protein GPJ56_007850 [Histomonas meleagridis]KAH0804070.1 hypothetical protein GO595_002900 [Histomonas meleagridis]